MTLKRAVKIGIGVALLALALWVILPHILLSMSGRAIITARLATVDAPIEGRLETNAHTLGDAVPADAPLGKVRNPRVERTRAWDVGLQVQRMESEIPTLTARRERLDAMAARLLSQRRSYGSGRVDQLEAQVAEARAEVQAAEAREREAEAQLRRVETLRQKGVTPEAGLDEAEASQAVAAARVQAARDRLETLRVALEAARGGTFLGDSYNDQPYSAQRRDEIALRLTELDAALARKRALLPNWRKLHERLKGQAERFAQARLASPVEGRLWSVAATAGEFVQKGQKLFELLDCKTVIVAATVSEADYNLLELNDSATFRPHGETVRYEGHIIKLAGPGPRDGEDRLAISLQSDEEDAFFVYLRFPALVEACSIGRTGTVVFEKEDVFVERVGSLVRGFLDRFP